MGKFKGKHSAHTVKKSKAPIFARRRLGALARLYKRCIEIPLCRENSRIQQEIQVLRSRIPVTMLPPVPVW